MPGVTQYRYPLYGGSTAEITFHGRPVTLNDVQLLRKHLAFLEEACKAVLTYRHR